MTNKKRPFVSVFIPYYNDRQYLGKAIQSVLDQSYQNFELILLNHATLDNSRKIAHSFDDPRIKHIDMEKNLGAGSGLLILEFLKIATGKYIKLFCADDILHPDGLEKLVGYMESNQDIDFAFGDVAYIDEKGKYLNESFFNNRPSFSINNTNMDCMSLYAIHFTSFLPYIGNIVKSEILRSIDIDKTMIMLLDMSLWLSILLKGYNIGYLNEIVGGYRIHGGQMSAVGFEDIAFRRSLHEQVIFKKLVAENLKDISTAKALFSTSVYIDKLKDVEDIPFIVFQFYLHSFSCQYSHIRLHELLENDSSRKKLEERFGYGIKQFREDYSKVYLSCPSPKKEEKKVSWKARLHSATINDLGLFSLFYLVFRKIYFTLTFRRFFKNRKKKKIFSM